jgi:hypothetical protein
VCHKFLTVGGRFPILAPFCPRMRSRCAGRDGNTVTTSGRVTFVIAKRGPDGQIVQFHRSPVPT